MIITETTQGEIQIIALDGALDATTSAELRNNPAVSDPEKTVVINMEKLDFIDSSGLGAIVGAARNKENRQHGILLSCMNDRVRKVFEITNAHKLFHIFDDTGAAVEFGETRQTGVR